MDHENDKAELARLKSTEKLQRMSREEKDRMLAQVRAQKARVDLEHKEELKKT